MKRKNPISDYLRKWKKYSVLKEEAEDRKKWKVNLSHEHKEEIQVISYKSIDLLTSSVLNDNYRKFIIPHN